MNEQDLRRLQRWIGHWVGNGLIALWMVFLAAYPVTHGGLVGMSKDEAVFLCFGWIVWLASVIFRPLWLPELP